jgi:hypothetical protein
MEKRRTHIASEYRALRATCYTCNGFGHKIKLKNKFCSIHGPNKNSSCNECKRENDEYNYYSDYMPCISCGGYGTVPQQNINNCTECMFEIHSEFHTKLCYTEGYIHCMCIRCNNCGTAILPCKSELTTILPCENELTAILPCENEVT